MGDSCSVSWVSEASIGHVASGRGNGRGQPLGTSNDRGTVLARYYDPTTAQFLTVDPQLAATLSPYGYVAGDPLNGTDPTGDCGGGGFFGFVCTVASDVGGAVATGAEWAATHPGTIAGVVGLAAVVVASGGAATPLALGLGAASLALTTAQAGEDVVNHNYVGLGLDLVSLIPGAGAELATARAGFEEAAIVGRSAELFTGGDLAEEIASTNRVQGAIDQFNLWRGWEGPLGWLSAGSGLVGGALTASPIGALAANCS
jgi:RHS repeat-associated protein